MVRSKHSSSYSVKIEDHKEFLNICAYDNQLFYQDDSRPLYERLGNINGVFDADYNGHFGARVWFTVDVNYDSHGTWIEIYKTIDNFIREAGEFYAKENKDKDDSED